MECLKESSIELKKFSSVAVVDVAVKQNEESSLKNIIYHKESTMSPTNEKDAGFCSGGSENEEDLLDHHHDHPHLQNPIGLITCGNKSNISSSNSSSSGRSTFSNRSPNSTEKEEPKDSEDKFTLPTTPISHQLPLKNKRKSSEPIRVVTGLSQLGPIKKRFKLENEMLINRKRAHEEAKEKKQVEEVDIDQPENLTTSNPMLSPDSQNPFRPWTNLMAINQSQSMGSLSSPLPNLNPAHSFKRHPGVTTLHTIRAEELSQRELPQQLLSSIPVQEEPIALIARSSVERRREVEEEQRRGRNGGVGGKQEKNTDSATTGPSLVDESSSSTSSFISPGGVGNSNKLSRHRETMESPQQEQQLNHQNQQRNYKNMTRERRIEANARERTRVHTISAAFEKLRHSVPAYSNTQKLSKLSVLRIACSYIMSLSRIADMDYSADQSEPSIGECVENLTKTIQTEGKLRKKKDE